MNYEKSVKPIESFLQYCELKRFSEDTKRNYCSALKMFIYNFEGKRPFEISDDEIEKYLLAIPGRSNRCTHHSV